MLTRDRRAEMAASLVHLAMVVSLSYLVVIRLTGENHLYLAVHLFLALRSSVSALSMVVQNFVTMCYSAANVDEAEDVNFFVRVSACR